MILLYLNKLLHSAPGVPPLLVQEAHKTEFVCLRVCSRWAFSKGRHWQKMRFFAPGCCTGKYSTTISLKGKQRDETLMCCACQCVWCQYIPLDPFQATSVASLNRGWEDPRTVTLGSLGEWMPTHHCHFLTRIPQARTF